MAYEIKRSDGTNLTTIADGDVNETSTSVSLLGKNMLGYGTQVAENFVHMLENFAASSAPVAPMHGQLWVHKGGTKSTLRICGIDGANTTWYDICSFIHGSSNDPATGGGINLSGVSLSARYADLAERFEASEPLEIGDVVCIGGDKEIRKAQMGDRVLGIISEKPGVRMNSEAGDDATHPYVGYIGRLPVRLVAGEEALRHQELYLSDVPGRLTTVRGMNSVYCATTLEVSDGDLVMVSYGK